MSRTFGSFEDLLYKLKQFLDTGRWSREICIKTSLGGDNHGYVTHYYMRNFNYERSKEMHKLELDIPANQEIREPRSIEFEDLKNEKYKITVANFTSTGVDCANVDEMFWWRYKENPRLNAKGGKRRKTRRKRGNGGYMSRRSRRRSTRVRPSILIGNDGNPEPVSTNAFEVKNYALDQILQELSDINKKMQAEYDKLVFKSKPTPYHNISPYYTKLNIQRNELLERYSQLNPPSAEIVAYPAESMRQGGRRKNKTRKKAPLKISSNFDGGNILRKRSEKVNGICIHTLEINKDPYPKTEKKKYQNWYYFKVSNNKGVKCKYVIENLVNIDNDWKGHNVVYTYDHKTFYRHPTIFNEKKNYISWNFISKKKEVWFSYYVPYSRNRVYKLNKKISNNKNVTKIILGKTSLKNKIEALRFGKGLKHVYIIARQHPGETIGSWMLEGFLKTFFSSKMKAKAKLVLEKYTFHIISMVNPDGVQLGHWYTQKNGHNCNREWNSKKCPEIQMVYKYINKQKGDIFFDFHGDEGCKKHFFTTCDKTKKNKNSSYHFFQKRMAHYNKNFSEKDYYQKAAHKVHGTFDCCWNNSLTLEGCMKHNYKKECLTLEPLCIGKDLFKSFYDYSLI